MNTIQTGTIIKTSKHTMTVESINARGDAIMSWEVEGETFKSSFKAADIQRHIENGTMEIVVEESKKDGTMELVNSKESTIPAFKGKTEKTFIVHATNTICEPGEYMVTIIDDKHILDVMVKRNRGFAKLNQNAHYLTHNRLGAYVKKNCDKF